MRTLIAAVGLVLLAGVPLSAQQAPPTPVQVEHTGEDGIGERIALHLRESFSNSRRYALTPSTEERFRLSLKMVSVAPMDDRRFSAYSIVWVATSPRQPYEQYYLESTVGYAGPGGVREAAERLMGRTDRVVEMVRKLAERVR